MQFYLNIVGQTKWTIVSLGLKSELLVLDPVRRFWFFFFVFLWHQAASVTRSCIHTLIMNWQHRFIHGLDNNASVPDLFWPSRCSLGPARWICFTARNRLPGRGPDVRLEINRNSWGVLLLYLLHPPCLFLLLLLLLHLYADGSRSGGVVPVWNVNVLDALPSRTTEWPRSTSMKFK